MNDGAPVQEAEGGAVRIPDGPQHPEDNSNAVQRMAKAEVIKIAEPNHERR
jgi:hypothetical protein